MVDTTEIANRKQADQQRAAIRAVLSGSDCCSALGIVARSTSPVFLLCHRLLDAGHDPNRSLRAYRGDTLALIVRSIGEGARLEISGSGVGFRRPPIAVPAPAGHRPRRKAA